jgi:hypothetical protein
MLFDTDSTLGRKSSQAYYIARVKKVILGSKTTNSDYDKDYTCEKDMGSIYYELLYSGKSGNGAQTRNGKKAYPIFGFLRQYPNVGEIVMMISGPSSDLNDNSQSQDLYYFPPFSVWNSVHHNVFPNMNEYVDFINKQVQSTTSTNPTPESLAIPQGRTFSEKPDIKTLRPFEGDTIIQGRFGQSIRFGSTVPELSSINTWSKQSDIPGEPITIITNSQKSFTKLEKESPVTIEDINRDGSSIYLTSKQSISIVDIEKYNVRSYALANSSNPQTQLVIVPEIIPVSNETMSAQDQDRMAQSNNPNTTTPNA